MTTTTEVSRKVITPEAIISYPHLFTPQAVKPGDPEKYSAALVFTDGTDLTPLKRAAVAAAREKFSQADKLIKAGKIKMPFRDDGEEKGYPEGSVFINVKTDSQPGVVSTIPDPDNGGRPTRIDDPEEVYPGAIVLASVVAYGWEYMGKKGVSFALNNIQKLRDGERLDGKVAAVDEFDADEDAVASLEDLTDEATPEEDDGEGDLDFKDLL